MRCMWVCSLSPLRTLICALACTCVPLFLQVLGKNHVIKGLDKCNFTPIYDALMADREAKKNVTKV